MKVVISLLITSALLIWFQNCEENRNLLSEQEPGPSNKKVVSVARQSYHKVKVRSFQSPDVEFKTEVDLETGILSVTADDGSKTNCVIDEAATSELQFLITDVEICEPPPLGPGEVACLALGIPDIELTSSNGETVWLQPLVCNTGSFLCDTEKDQSLRDLLSEITCQ